MGWLACLPRWLVEFALDKRWISSELGTSAKDGRVSANKLGNFLGLLRLIKQTGPDQSPRNLVQLWTGGNAPPSSLVLKIAAYVAELAEEAEAYIGATQLSDEAKSGLLQTTWSVKQAFDLVHIQQSVQQSLPALDAAISQFAILISAAGLDAVPPPDAEVLGLVEDIDRMISSLEDADIDPLVASAARKHLNVLKTLLQNVDAFGVEAALAAYSELVIRLRSADLAASAASSQTLSKIWPEIERWAGRLAIIDQAYTQGGRLLGELGGTARLLLSHLPPVPGITS